MQKKIEYIMDIGNCPMGVVELSLARGTCSWKRGWAVGFTYGRACVKNTVDTASTLRMLEDEFLDLAAEVGGSSGMYLHCYPKKDEYGDVMCVKELFFKKKITAIRFLKKLEEYRREAARRSSS